MEFTILKALKHISKPGAPFDLTEIVTALRDTKKINRETYDLWMEMERSYGPPQATIVNYSLRYEGVEPNDEWVDGSEYRIFLTVQNQINQELVMLKRLLTEIKH